MKKTVPRGTVFSFLFFVLVVGQIHVMINFLHVVELFESVEQDVYKRQEIRRTQLCVLKEV